jgi:hypothetical protein
MIEPAPPLFSVAFEVDNDAGAEHHTRTYGHPCRGVRVVRGWVEGGEREKETPRPSKNLGSHSSRALEQLHRSRRTRE